jgi:hypothetical protein
VSIGFAAVANAQAPRTWVSGVGDDANPCSRTAPCKTFAGAISKTASDGEIDVLDPGSFGTVTITKGITIDGGCQVAGVTSSGTSGMVINAPSTSVVIIRNISINGMDTSTNGIRFLAGKSLSVDHCIINRIQASNTARGLDIEPNNAGGTAELHVRDTTIQETGGEGILIQPGGGTSVIANINNVRQSHSTSTSGLNVVNNAKVMVQYSDFSQNPVGAGITAQQGSTEVDVDGGMMSNNAFGVVAGVGGGAAVFRLSRCTIAGNTSSGALINAPATVTGFSSNMIAGNAGNNTIATVAAQ